MEFIILNNFYSFINCFSKTICIWIFSSMISIFFGTIIGFCLSRYYSNSFIKFILEKCILILRGIPFYIQLSIFYFSISNYIYFLDSAIISGVFSLGICSSAYTSIIVKTLINEFDILQWYSARILGYSKINFFKNILFPQVYYKFLCLMINELDSILKSTTILSTIGVLELTRFGFNIISKTMNPIPVYLFLALIYLILSILLSYLMNYFSKKDKELGVLAI